MIIKVLILFFVLFVLWRTFLRYKANDISVREFFVWTVFWFIVVLASFLPKKTDILAQKLGVERGADLLVYLSIMVLFFVVFKLIVKQEKIDRQITELVRKEAIDEKIKSEKND